MVVIRARRRRRTSAVTTVTVRRATAADVTGLAEVLARAFVDDPVFVFAIPDADRRRALLPRYFELVTAGFLDSYDETWTAADGAAVALWAPPGDWSAPATDTEALGPFIADALGERAPLSMQGLAQLTEHHPTEPHWYLRYVGVDPAHQGKGSGGALLRHTLERADDAALPAYLESTKEQNVGWYERFGFTVVGELDLPQGHVWRMWRAAGSGG
jgi:ribosomal protein S18 acetylase RimI-like enzyme